MSDLKDDAKAIFLETLRAIDPALIIRRWVRRDGERLIIGDKQIDLRAHSEVVIAGMGKASVTMGAAVEEILGDRLARGLLVVDRRPQIDVRSEVIVAGHPLPDPNSLVAGQKLARLVTRCADDSLIIFLVSGGGSSLVELPISDEITLDDLRLTNAILTGCGASIHQINVVRKHLSRIKAGGLGHLARASRCVALYISDVNPGDLRSIASNPILPEDLVEEELITVLSQFNLLERLPASVAGALRGRREPRPAEGIGKEYITALLLDNAEAVRVAAHIARQKGFVVETDAETIEEQYPRVAARLIEHILRLREANPNRRVGVISGGEVLCPVRGDGAGGRNQEFVLYSAALLAGKGMRSAVAVLSGGTDGIDGNSDAAGAIADGQSVITAAESGLDASAFIHRNDSHSFFRQTQGLLVTGPTGNNVRDLRILLAE